MVLLYGEEILGWSLAYNVVSDILFSVGVSYNSYQKVVAPSSF